MASYNEQAPEVVEAVSIRLFGAPYGEGGEHVATTTTQSGAAELAEDMLHPGQHARIYNESGEEVGRVYPGEE